jgi:uncharacterized membrane protein
MAMILMAIYHFCFDLDLFGVIHQDMNSDEFWLNFRAVIMSSFMGLVGVGLYLGSVDWSQKRYWSRLVKVAVCAAVISLVTYIQFGDRWTFFGVLHFVVVATLLGPWLIRWPVASMLAGVAIVVLPLVYRSLFFARPFWIMTGLSPVKPMTEDFSPLAPWLGVVLLGVFVGWLARRWLSSHCVHEIPWLSRLGHHSLAFYMTHQLVLFPIAWVISKIF